MAVAKRSMVVGFGILTFRLHACRSLKAKRRVVKSLVALMRNHFNASVAEVGSNDVHQRIEVGFSMVGNNGSVVNSKMDKLLNLVDDFTEAEIIDSEMELMHL